jgi:hypothetical protein
MHKGKPVGAQTQNGEQHTSLSLSSEPEKQLSHNQQENLRESEGHVREKLKENTEDQRRRERNCNSEGPQKQKNKQIHPYVRVCLREETNPPNQARKERELKNPFHPSLGFDFFPMANAAISMAYHRLPQTLCRPQVFFWFPAFLAQSSLLRFCGFCGWVLLEGFGE